MWRNYVNAALRNLVRNKVYAGLNIVGLAVGFSAVLLIALFVRDELSYDKWLPGSERTYILGERLAIPGQAPLVEFVTPQELKAPMLLDYPGIENIVRLEPSAIALRNGDIETADEKIFWADPDFFKVIKLEGIAGDLNQALAEPNSVVISRKIARKYFGRDTPIGETLEFDRRLSMKVTAVIEDLPSNTQFNTEVIASALTKDESGIARKDANPARFAQGWNVGAYTYVTLRPGTAIEDIGKQLPDFILKHKSAVINFVGKTPLFFKPMSDVHLQEDLRGGNFYSLSAAGSRATIASLSVIGALILLVASINFVNLTTARASRRSLEVGMRKVVGAEPGDLVRQFIGESLLYTAFGMIVAMALVSLAMPAFNAYLNRTMVFDFWADPALLAGIVVVVAFVGVLAGAYPAFVLSSFRPKAVLKSGKINSSGIGLLRNVLVIVQFAIMIGLILMTFVVYRQTSFAMNQGVRLDTAGMHVLRRGCTQAAQNAITALPGVAGTACSGGPVLNQGKNAASITLKDATPLTIDLASIDFGFFELYGIQPIAGRSFQRDHVGDQQPAQPKVEPGQMPPPPPGFTWPMIVNEALARKISPGNPAAAVGQVVGTQFGPNKGESEIIGVVPDFALDVSNQVVPTTVYILVPAGENPNLLMSVKLKAGDETATLAAIDKTWKEVGPARPISRYAMTQYLAELNAPFMRQAEIFAAFAVVAVFIAALGLFGLSAFTAERRTKEIGLRKSLGADRAPIVRLLVWQFTKPVLWANLIAWPVGFYLVNRWLNGLAYHIDIEFWLFLAASLIALAIAWATILGYSVKVSGEKPSRALRYE